MAKIVPDKFAIMTVDPGKVTGCSQGVFRTDRGADMLETVIRRALKKKQIISWEERGVEYEQSWHICERWVAFRFKMNVEYGIPAPDIHLVIESFQLRTNQAHLEPVGITHGILTLLARGAGVLSDGVKPKYCNWPAGKPEFQEPSTAKHMGNDRLKRLGLYVVASEHRRDALRHLGQKVNDIL